MGFQWQLCRICEHFTQQNAPVVLCFFFRKNTTFCEAKCIWHQAIGSKINCDKATNNWIFYKKHGNFAAIVLHFVYRCFLLHLEHEQKFVLLCFLRTFCKQNVQQNVRKMFSSFAHATSGRGGKTQQHHYVQWTNYRRRLKIICLILQNK